MKKYATLFYIFLTSGYAKQGEPWILTNEEGKGGGEGGGGGVKGGRGEVKGGVEGGGGEGGAEYRESGGRLFGWSFLGCSVQYKNRRYILIFV